MTKKVQRVERMKIKNGLVYRNHEFVKTDVCITNGVISDDCDDSEIYDAEGMYVIPGLIDIHLHGANKADLSDADIDAIDVIAGYEVGRGITTICPATMTCETDHLQKIIKCVYDWKEKKSDIRSTMADVAGVYLEGPFISPKKCGAQNGKYACLPDSELLEKYIGVYDDVIKIVTIAPELPGTKDFVINYADKYRLSIAHSEADYDTASEAFRYGVKGVTHLYNAMEPVSARNPGIPGAAFDNPNVSIELICDGVHVHPSNVRKTFKEFGDERIIMISDSMRACGSGNGHFMLGDTAVRVNGKIAVAEENGVLAGSVCDLMTCLVTAVTEIGIRPESAVRCVTENPAKALGLYNVIGSIDVGKRADICILNKDLSIKKVIKSGKSIATAIQK